jgi:signal transduction histidine kinase
VKLGETGGNGVAFIYFPGTNGVIMGWTPPTVLLSSVSVPVLVAALSAVIAVVVGLLALRKRPEPLALPLAVLMFGIAFWAVPSVCIALVESSAVVLALVKIQYLGIATVPVAYFFLALRYGGYEQWFSRPVYAIAAAIPGLTVVLAATNQWHTLFWEVTSRSPELVLDNGLWFWVVLSYSYVMVIAGLFVLANVALSADALYRKQSLLLLVGGLAPLAVNAAGMAGLLPATEVGLTAPALTVSGLTFAVALFRYDFLDLSPAAYRNLSDVFGDGVLVFDEQSRLVDANDHAERILDDPLAPRTPATEVFGQDLDALDGTIVSSTEGTRRFYSVGREELRDRQGRLVGSVVAMREVTDLKQHEQRLDVTNRILRHNLRNELNIILGRATALERSLADPPEELDSIQQAARRLNALGEKARRIQSSIAWDADSLLRVDLTAAASSVVEERRAQHPSATITLDTPPNVFVCAPDADVVATVVDNLVENGIEHNDSPEPRVDVDIEVGDETVTLRVTDDGPGIPDSEIAVIQQGEETALEHGSGIGLWLVHWFVSSMGGQIAFEQHDGTVVEVQLQRAANPPARRTAARETTETEVTEESTESDHAELLADG